MAIVTWNPIDKDPTWLLSNGDLTAKKSSTGSTWTALRTNKGVSKGKWYWETKVNATGVYLNIGVGTLSSPLNTGNTSFPSNVKAYDMRGTKNLPNSTYGATYTTGDLIGIKLNMDIGTIEFLKNNVSQGIAFNDLLTLGTVFPYLVDYNTGVPQVTANFGATPFVYPVPNGYKPYQIANKSFILFGDEYKKLDVGAEEIPAIPDGVVDLIPKMTSNNTPSPIVVSASSTISGDYPIL